MVTLYACNQGVLLLLVLSICLKLSLLLTVKNKLQGTVNRKHVSYDVLAPQNKVLFSECIQQKEIQEE